MVPVGYSVNRDDEDRPYQSGVIQSLDDVEEFEGDRIDTGIKGLNRVFGTNRNDPRQGLHLPSSTIFAGGQGCGKTTLILKMLALIKERNSLLLSTEQVLSEIKASIVGTGLRQRATRIKAFSLLDYQSSIEVAMDQIEALDPRVVVVDSVSKLRHPGFKHRDRLGAQIEMVEILKRDAEQNNRATILVSHLTKQDQVSGARESAYDVSTVLVLEKCDAHLRLLHCPEKNRFGDLSEKAYFRIDKHGIRDLTDTSEDPRFSNQEPPEAKPSQSKRRRVDLAPAG